MIELFEVASNFNHDDRVVIVEMIVGILGTFDDCWVLDVDDDREQKFSEKSSEFGLSFGFSKFEESCILVAEEVPFRLLIWTSVFFLVSFVKNLSDNSGESNF